MGYIIRRTEEKNIGKSWLLVYGRRKTGKTFLLRTLCKFENYFLVKRNLDILIKDKSITINELKRKVSELLKRDETVVLDEFQRLDEGTLEELVQLHPRGRLIISGSSQRIIKKVFSSNSPLLGFFVPLKVSLISPRDILTGLKSLSAERKVEFSVFLREPWLIPLFEGEEINQFIYKIVTKLKYVITSLVGEIFNVEERELSKKYGAILELIGNGVWGTKELTGLLYNRNLIPDPSPTHLIQYLKNLEEMGLVEGIKLYKSKNKHFYRLCSPIMNIYYYLDGRYNISNREVSFKEMEPTLRKLINFEIQNFVADYFAEKEDGRKEYFVSPSKEIDFIITQRNKPVIVGEVKWKKVNFEDLRKFSSSVEDFSCRRIIFCKKGENLEGVKVIEAQQLK